MVCCIMFGVNTSFDKAKYSVTELVAYDKLFDEREGKFIDTVTNIGEPEILEEMIIFAVCVRRL